MAKAELSKLKLTCPWCFHKDTYLVGKGDQPPCKNCNRLFPLKQK